MCHRAVIIGEFFTVSELIFSMQNSIPCRSHCPHSFTVSLCWLYESNSYCLCSGVVSKVDHRQFQTVSKSNPRLFGGYDFFGANNFYFGRSDLIIGTEWLHRVLGPCLAPQSDTFNISRFSGGEFMKIQDVERRKFPFFSDFFVNTTPI